MNTMEQDMDDRKRQDGQDKKLINGCYFSVGGTYVAGLLSGESFFFYLDF